MQIFYSFYTLLLYAQCGHYLKSHAHKNKITTIREFTKPISKDLEDIYTYIYILVCIFEYKDGIRLRSVM